MGATTERTHWRRASPNAVLAIVAFSVFVAADDLTVVTTMLRPIIGDLGLVLPDGLDDAAWIVNVYLIAFVAVMPIAGRISDVVGRRATFVAAYVVFLVGTTLIPLMDSLGPFLVARVLTALGGGAMVPVALAVVGDVFAEARRARALGTLAAIETLGWVWGPLYGAILVRFLSWEWQFWLNIPLALVGLAAVWWALEGHERHEHGRRVDWWGGFLLTVALVALNLALLGNAEIQSVTDFEQLTGSSGWDFRWLYLVALAAGALFVRHQHVAADPLIDRSLLTGRTLQVALAVNFVVGAALVIAMVDVPIYLNSVELDLKSAAVVTGWVLASLTASMAVTSYAGGRLAARWGYRLPIVVGMSVAGATYLFLGITLEPDTSYLVLALLLGLLGAGLGLVTAPTSSVVVDAAAPPLRGAAAATLMVIRLMGLSVGLSVLTAWGLARFNALRSGLDLPPITDPGFENAAVAAQADLTTQSIAETFVATSVLVGVGLLLSLLIRDRSAASGPTSSASSPMSSEGAHMSWLQRNSGMLIAVLGGLVVVAFALIAVMFVQLQDSEERLDQATDDIARVEAGAALFGSQVTGFQEQLGELQPTIGEGLEEAIAGLEEFANSTIDFDVEVDEVVTIDTEIVLDRDLTVPIDETLPIDESFDTTIEVETPLGFSVPVDVTVPVDIDVPIDLDLDVAVNETIPVSAEVPVQLSIPLSVEVSGTELATLADSLAVGLQSLSEVLLGFGD